MLSLVQRILRAATSFDTVLSRLDRIESTINKIETKLKKFDKIADENDALWQMLDEQKEIEQVFMEKPPEGALIEIGYVIDYIEGDDDDSAE